jgi:hypothetical protein
MSNQDDKNETIARWRDDNACWLDNEPAKIVGWKNDFPTVAQISGPLAFQWSWAAVNRIMTGDRRFKSN